MRLIDADRLLNPGYTDMFDEPMQFNWVSRKAIEMESTVDAIPTEWIKKWCNTQNGKSLEERLLKRYGVLTLLEDWEKEK